MIKTTDTTDTSHRSRGEATPFICPICQHETTSETKPESVPVRPNVRKFSSERFTVWRCPECKSLHSLEDADLDYYYSHYPFLVQETDWVLRLAYTRFLKRLVHCGVKKGDRILDYGCGGGTLVDFLNSRGYNAVGYDPYSTRFNNLNTQDGLYDCVIAQDVVEHANNPIDILRILDDLTTPGGLLVIGTPNASGLKLSDPERYLHELHQPYHRHIFTENALCKAACSNGLSWELIKYYPTPHLNMPGVSVPFIHHYARSADNTLDVIFERKPDFFKLWLNPKTYYLLLFGYFLCEPTDMLLVFRKS